MAVAGISKSTMDKMARFEIVSMTIIDKLCMCFNCPVNAVREYVNTSGENETMANNANTYKSIYTMHKYWGKKPFNEISKFIERYTSENEVVLDSFCGSGVTLIEALRANRKCIGVDLNPIAMLISKVSMTAVDVSLVKNTFTEIQHKLKSTINSLYETKINGENTLVTHTIWQNDQPVEVWYATSASKKKIREGLPIDITMSRSPSLKAKWYPDTPMFENSRINITKDERVSDLFTPRALVGLSYLLYEIKTIEDEKIRNIFLLTLSGTLSQASNLVFVIRERKKNGISQSKAEVGSWVIGYWIPREHFEINVWNCFENRYKRVLKGIGEINEIFGDKDDAYIAKHARLINGTATALPIDEDSVDYVFIDPPHANRILYLEQSLMWNAWLQLDKDINWDSEIIVSEAKERKNKNAENYTALLSRAFSEIKRVLKPNKVFSMAFNCLDDNTWIETLRLFTKYGFVLCNIEPLVYSATSVIQDNRKNALKTDFVLSFINTEREDLKEIVFNNDKDLLEERIVTILKDHPEHEVYNVMNALFEETMPSGYIFKPSYIVKKCAELM